MTSKGVFTLGADPEFFLRDTRTGTTVPAVGLIGGTKEEPIPIPGLEGLRGFTMQEDNVMVEFNIPPARNTRQFVQSINTALQYLDMHIFKTTDGVLERDFRASRLFGFDLLSHPQASVFGCSPDFDAYSSGQAFPTVSPDALAQADGAWRFAGGHVHIGYREYIPHDLPEFVMAQFMDLFVGATAVTGFDHAQGERAKLYGVPGRFRPTKYGLEYRSLSNLWVHGENWRTTVAMQTERLLIFLRVSPLSLIQDLYGQVPWPSLRQAIIDNNAGDLELMRRTLRRAFSTTALEEYL